MPIVEYDPGTTFPGVIGRTAEESSPAWPAPVRARRALRTSCSSCSTTRATASSGCYGSPIETPHLDGIAANGLRYNNMHTTALCSPSRSCIVTGRNHHANGMACITELATGFPGYNGVMPLENGMLSEMLVEQGYSTFMVGKWHLTPSEPGDRGRAVRPLAARPRLRALLRLPRRRHAASGIPTSSTTTTRSSRRRRPRRATTSARTSSTRAIAFIADAKQVDPDKPFFLHLCFGADARAASRGRRSGPTGTRACSTTAGTPTARRPSRGRRSSGIVPADAELSRHDPDVPEWDVAAGRRAAAVRRMMEVFAGFLSHTDHQVGRLLDFLERTRRARQHADHGGLRQRRQRRGRPDRHDQRGAVLQQRAGAARGEPRR